MPLYGPVDMLAYGPVDMPACGAVYIPAYGNSDMHVFITRSVIQKF